MKIESFEEFLNNAEKLRQEYLDYSCSFFEKKRLLRHQRKLKDTIYSIKCSTNLEYKKNIIWEYLNGDLEYEVMAEILRRTF